MQMHIEPRVHFLFYFIGVLVDLQIKDYSIMSVSQDRMLEPSCFDFGVNLQEGRWQPSSWLRHRSCNLPIPLTGAHPTNLKTIPLFTISIPLFTAQSHYSQPHPTIHSPIPLLWANPTTMTLVFDKYSQLVHCARSMCVVTWFILFFVGLAPCTMYAFSLVLLQICPNI